MKALAAAGAVAWLTPSSIAVAQGDSRQAETTYSLSVTPFHQYDVDIIGGASFSLSSVFLRFEGTRSLSETINVGLAFKFEQDDYDFLGGGDLGAAGPWNEIRRFGLGVPVFARFDNNWSLGATPSVDWLQEEGADSSESVSYGTTLPALRSFERDRRIGFGPGVLRDVDDDTTDTWKPHPSLMGSKVALLAHVSLSAGT